MLHHADAQQNFDEGLADKNRRRHGKHRHRINRHLAWTTLQR